MQSGIFLISWNNSYIAGLIFKIRRKEAFIMESKVSILADRRNYSWKNG